MTEVETTETILPAETPKPLIDVDVIELLKKYASKTDQKPEMFEFGVRTGIAPTGEQVFQITIRWAVADLIVATGKDYKKILNGLWDMLDNEESVAKLKANVVRADMMMGGGQALAGGNDSRIISPAANPNPTPAPAVPDEPQEDKKKFVKSYGQE